MPAVKLTPAQRQVLALAADGKVYRSERGGPPFRWIAVGPNGPFVVAPRTMRRLLGDRLLSVGPNTGGRLEPRSYAAPTAAGRTLLDSLNPEGRP